MKRFLIEPEVAGGLGVHTVMDRTVHPPVVNRLHYEFDGWLGDELLESFPVFIVTEDMKRRLSESHLTGIEFAPVEVTVSDLFRELHPDRKLPPFHWLKVHGQVGGDDFATAGDGRLVVSQNGLDAIEKYVPHAIIERMN